MSNQPMSPDEQIAVIAARRDGKSIEKHDPTYVSETWNPMDEDEEFDFSCWIYRIRPEPPKPREVFINEYHRGLGMFAHDTRDLADRNAVSDRIRCVRLVEDLSYDGSVGKE